MPTTIVVALSLSPPPPPLLSRFWNLQKKTDSTGEWSTKHSICLLAKSAFVELRGRGGRRKRKSNSFLMSSSAIVERACDTCLFSFKMLPHHGSSLCNLFVHVPRRAKNNQLICLLSMKMQFANISTLLYNFFSTVEQIMLMLQNALCCVTMILLKKL